MTIMHVVSAIIRREDQILMVQQPDVDGLYWFIPGGVVEQGELIHEALQREVMEETGLTITDEAHLAYITQVDAIYQSRQVVAFVLEISAYQGDLNPNDPDNLTHDVAFVSITEAINRLNRVIWASMRDPLQAYLRGEISRGSVWQYRQHAFRDFELVNKMK